MNYFKIEELVSPAVYNKYKDFAWAFFDAQCIYELNFIRHKWGKAITINDWDWGGNYTQSGYREKDDFRKQFKKLSDLYCSAHTMGKGFDLKTNNNKAFYNFLVRLLENEELKYFKRIEHIDVTPTWCHIDAFNIKPIVFKP